MRERLVGRQIESCTPAALQARWLGIENRMRSPCWISPMHFITLFALRVLSWNCLEMSRHLKPSSRETMPSLVTSTGQGLADMSLDMSEKCQLVPMRIPSLFEQNVLKAVGRTQIEGSCKVSAGKTNWITSWKLYPCSLAGKKWGALEAPWQMTPIRTAFTCSKACDIVAEDTFSVASQHSIGLIDIK